ncbi:UNKNOWN [Stylonychia lemnae]|uniref:Uncharacterized protein n=1 Tax=Stylonychia lemnae TaxID=5949 RepID=A0A077ZMP7_STYLE|nr:UNKNOWN [Stylonychia lemnae]|eukprot:CDW71242.1 UNKNOWN [Stylonychia lemnae]
MNSEQKLLKQLEREYRKEEILTKLTMSKSAKFLKDWQNLQYNKPPITWLSSKPITIHDASLKTRDLPDHRSKDQKQKIAIEAFVVNEPIKNGHEVIYSQTLDCDYILQPKGMVGRGSMCVAELYGKNMRIKVVQTLIDKKKKEDQIEKWKIQMKREESFSPVTITSSSYQSPLMRQSMNVQNSYKLMNSQTIQQDVRVRPFTSKHKSFTPNRFKMLKEDEKDLYNVFKDAQNFLGQDLIKNSHFDFSKYEINEIKQKKLSKTNSKNNYESPRISLQKSRENSSRNSFSKRRKSFNAKIPDKKKFQIKQPMNSYMIDLPSDSEEESKQDDSKVIQEQKLFNLDVLLDDKQPLRTQQIKSKQLAKVSFNFNPEPKKRNSTTHLQNFLQLSKGKFKSLEGQIISDFIEQQKEDSSETSFEDYQQYEVQRNQYEIDDEQKRLKQRNKIKKLLNIETDSNSRFQSSNTLKIKQKLQDIENHSNSSDYQQAGIIKYKTENSKFMPKLNDQQSQPESGAFSRKSSTNHEELVYYKKAGGLCVVNSVVPKKTREGVSIMKQKQMADVANNYMRIQAQLHSRKRTNLSVEAQLALQKSRGRLDSVYHRGKQSIIYSKQQQQHNQQQIYSQQTTQQYL